MINELERLLSNAHAPHDALCFSSVVVMTDFWGSYCQK